MTAPLTLGPLTSAYPDVVARWDDLLAMSNSDPLFNGRDWQELWWATWGEPAGLELRLTVAEGERSLAPLYLERTRIKGIPVRRLQFLGASAQSLSTPRCEYRDILAADADRPAADQALLDVIARQRWDDFVVRDVKSSSPLKNALERWAAERGYQLRVIHQDRAYAQNCEGDFSDYLQGLKPETRRKLFNKRKQLAQLGSVELQNAYPQDVDDFFDRLNDFHRLRWGTEVYGASGLRFQKELLRRLAEQGARPWLSVLRLNGEAISVSYNILLQGRLYNIQSGFRADIQKSLSLGLIHIGYVLEEAFADREVRLVDFLAGFGKKTNYKADLCAEVVELASFQVVRNPLLKLLYRLHDLRKRRAG